MTVEPHDTGTHAGSLVVRIALMGAQILGIVAAFTLTKAVRDAVFLSHFRMHDLALVSLLLTVLSGIAVAAHQRWIGRRFSRGTAAVASLVLVSITLVGFHLALRVPRGWAAWGLYLWSGVFGIFLVAQFWIMALDVFDPREARRAFPIAAAGASVGGVLGGGLADRLARGDHEDDMLLVVAGMLLFCALLAAVAWALRPTDSALHEGLAPELRGASATWNTMLASPLLRTAAVVLVCSSVAGTLLDWQLKAVAKSWFHSDRESMTVFFGRVLAVSSVLALLLQTLTGRLLRRVGVARGLVVLPTIIVLGAVLIIVQPTLGVSLLAVAFTARTAEMGVRYAIDKPALELLYMPVEGPLRAAAKSWLDTLADRFGGAISAAIWLLLQVAFDIEEPSHVRVASVATGAISIVWIAIAWRARRHHLEAFRVALARGEPAVPGESGRALDREGAAIVRGVLEHGTAAEAQVALELLADPTNVRIDVNVVPLLQHPRAAIRAKAVDVLRLRGEAPRIEWLRSKFADPSIAVRVASLEWILTRVPEGMAGAADPTLPEALRDLLAWAAQPLPRRREIAAELALSPDPAKRATAAVMAASVSDGAVLRRLCDDPQPLVVAAALGALGPPRSVDDVMLILRLGARSGARAHAIERLSRAPVARLIDAWGRAQGDGARGLLSDAIAKSSDPSAAETLASLSENADSVLRHRAWRGLALRRGDGAAGPARSTCERLIDAQVERIAMRMVAQAALERARSHADWFALLVRAMHESIEQEIVALFDLLALVAPAHDVREACLWLRDGSPRTRATCVEFLDNALPAVVRTHVVPWLEPADRSRGRAILLAQRGLDEPRSVHHAIQMLAQSDDGWLRALAVNALTHQGERQSRLPHRDAERDERVEQVFAEIRGAVPWPT